MKLLDSITDRQITIGFCFTLVLMVCFVFGQSLTFDFVNYDDNQYVYDNSHISEGVTIEGVSWVVAHPHSSNWHPLTSLSHMFDCQLYGLNPAGHHLTNVVLHSATALLLFLTLRVMTGSLWRSAVVAALFAVHPLRVESVVWISERKDVLSGLFFMLTLGAYTRYTRVASAGWRVAGANYLLVVLLFSLGLMSKPMLVTLPFVLLLLDYWPLGRVGSTGGMGCRSDDIGLEPPAQPLSFIFVLLEKLPLVVLSAIFCGITVWAQQRAVTPMEASSVSWRFGNALLSYVTYIRQWIVPANLAVLYPATGEKLPFWMVGVSAVFLGSVTLVVLRKMCKQPYLLVGWLWYLGMLIPVIGILQVGGQAHADRYTYLPQIGLCILGVWYLADWAISKRRRILMGIFIVVVLVCLISATRIQAAYWCNSVSLWSRALACTENNFVAHSNLGTMLFAEGSTAEAIDHFKRALQIEPKRSEVWNNLAVAYADEGRWGDAVTAAQRAVMFAEIQCSSPVIEAIRSRLQEYQTELKDLDK